MQENDAKSGIAERLRHAISLCAPDYAPENARWSLRIFSKEAGIPYRTLQDYLAGARLPGADSLQKFAKKGIDINWILLGNERHGTDYSQGNEVNGSELPINDKDIEALIRAMAIDWADRINTENTKKTGRSLPLLALIKIHDHFSASLTVSYLRTIEAVPHFLNKGMTKADMLKVLETASEASLNQASEQIITEYSAWTTALSGYFPDNNS